MFLFVGIVRLHGVNDGLSSLARVIQIEGHVIILQIFFSFLFVVSKCEFLEKFVNTRSRRKSGLFLLLAFLFVARTTFDDLQKLIKFNFI